MQHMGYTFSKAVLLLGFLGTLHLKEQCKDYVDV